MQPTDIYIIKIINTDLHPDTHIELYKHPVGHAESTGSKHAFKGEIVVQCD